MKKISIGSFIEKGIENGFIEPSQVVAFTDWHNNLKWIGKAEFAPIYLDWCVLGSYQFVGNELQIKESR